MARRKDAIDGICPYDTSNLKYPLPLNKSKVRYHNAYVYTGGVQLMEMMEREFPIEWIEANKDMLRINDLQIQKLKWWIKHDWYLGSVVKEFEAQEGHRNQSDSHVKSIFNGFQGIFKKILPYADLDPRADKDNNITFLYSFIDYEDWFQNGNYLIFNIKGKVCDGQPMELNDGEYKSQYVKHLHDLKCLINGELTKVMASATDLIKVIEILPDGTFRNVGKHEEAYKGFKDMLEVTDLLAPII